MLVLLSLFETYQAARRAMDSNEPYCPPLVASGLTGLTTKMGDEPLLEWDESEELGLEMPVMTCVS